MEKLAPRARAALILSQLDQSEETIAGHLRAQSGVAGPDRALLSELVYGVVRHRSYLDDVLRRKLSKPLSKLPPQLLIFLEIALYQLLFLERIPSYAIIWEAVEGTKRRFGPMMARLANGVLRAIDREKDTWQWRPPTDPNTPLESLATAYSFPMWLLERWRAVFSPEELLSLLSSLASRPEQAVRVNALKTSLEDMETQLSTDGVAFHRVPSLPQALVIEAPKLDRSHSAYQSGQLSFQALSSQIVVDTAAALLMPGQRFFDACCGAGGKSLGIAERLGSACKYDAYDVKSTALADFEHEKVRLDLPMITILSAAPADKAHYDVVLVDAPCSGLGTLQKNPELKWRRSTDLSRFAERQLEILSHAARVVNASGYLIYSVCSFEPEETDAVLAAFLGHHPEFSLHSLSTPESLTTHGTATPHGWKLYPHRVQSEGFFLTVLKRGV